MIEDHFMIEDYFKIVKNYLELFRSRIEILSLFL